MAYDTALAERIESLTADNDSFQKKKMFGGLAYMLNGNMCVGVHKDLLVLRLDPTESEAVLAHKHTRPMDLTGKPMKGWFFVEREAWESDTDLRYWFNKAVGFVSTLPAK